MPGPWGHKMSEEQSTYPDPPGHRGCVCTATRVCPGPDGGVHGRRRQLEERGRAIGLPFGKKMSEST